MPGGVWGMVFRKKCPCCRTRFTFLPNDVLPLHSYSRHLIFDRLMASLAGDADCSKEFYADRGLLPDDFTDDALPGQKGTSWSDHLSGEKPLRPSPQLFGQWRRKWASRGQLWLHGLLLACIFSGCDLKSRLGESFHSFSSCSVTLRPLLLSGGLVALLQGEPVRSALTTTVLLLGCAPAHKSSRAVGRPPPHYGGDLEFTELPAP